MKRTDMRAGALRSVLPAAIMAAAAMAAGPAAAQEARPLSPELTPKLQDLLREEMQSIEEASQSILSALIAGDDESVAELAQRIHDSFIMEQSMTPEDEQALMAAAPADFLSRDQEFHELSAALADAARNGERAAQHDMFSRMISACSACHALYATDRFPDLAE